MSAQKRENSIHDYAGLVWRRRRTAMFAATLFACVVLVGFNFVPRKYTADAVFERRSTNLTGDHGQQNQDFDTIKPVLEHQITGGPAIRQALEDLGYLDHLPRTADGELTEDSRARLAAVMGGIQSNLKVDWIVRSSNIDRVTVRLSSQDPVIAARVPNQLVENYVSGVREELQQQLSASHTFLTERVETARQRLAELRQQRYAFTAEHRDLMPENPSYFSERLEQIDEDLTELGYRRRAVSAELTTLQSLEEAHSQDVVTSETQPNPEYHAMLARLEELRNQLDEARNELRMTDRHPRVVRLRESITEAETELAGIPAQIVVTSDAEHRPANQTLVVRIQHLQTEMEQCNAEITRLEEARNRYEQAHVNLLPVLNEYEELSTRIADAENEMAAWQSSLMDVQMALDAERNGSRTHLSVVKLASPVYRPNWPPLSMVFGLAIGGGLVFGAVLVIVLSRLSRGYDTPTDLTEETELPLLGVVGPILTPAARRLRMVTRYAVVPAAMSLLLAVVALGSAGMVLSYYQPEKWVEFLEQFGPPAHVLLHNADNAWITG